MNRFVAQSLLVLGSFTIANSTMANHAVDAEFAYEQIKALQAENSGHVDFDMRFALVAIAVHRYDEAIFALERVLQNQPNNGRARAELGRCYYETGQYHLARTLFKQVSENPTTPAVVQHNINYYVNEMEQRGSQFDLKKQFYVEAGVGRDNNINAGSDLSSIDIPNLGTVALSEASLSQDSNTQRVAAGGKLYQATSKYKGWSVQADVQQINTPENSNYDQGLGSLVGAYHWRDSNDRYQMGLQYQQLSLGGERFLQSLGMAAQWHRTISERLVSGMTLQWHDVDFADSQNFRDHKRLMASADLLFSDGQWRHHFGTFIGNENPKNAQYEYALRDAIWGLSYRLSYQLNPTMTPYLSFQQASSNYGDNHPIFGVARHDRQRQTEIGVVWQTSHGLTITPSLSDNRNSSNIKAYQYNRERAQVNVRYTF